MLDASHHGYIDQIIPFLRATVNNYSGNITFADVSNLFSQYVELVRFPYYNGTSLSYSKNDNVTFKEISYNFIAISVNSFRKMNC